MPVLTDAFARIAEPIEGRDETTFHDERTPGLALRVRSSGNKTWIWRRRDGTKTARYTIGSTASFKASAARAVAEQRNAELAAQQHGMQVVRMDRSAKRQAAKSAGDTLKTVSLEWLARKATGEQKLRDSTLKEYRRHLIGNTRGPDIGALAEMPASLIKRSDITATILHLEMTVGEPTARAVRRTLSSLMTWLSETDRLGDAFHSPVQDSYAPPPAKPRRRFLDEDEMRAVWRAAHKMQGDYGAIVKLLMLTGHRLNEIGKLKHREINLRDKFADIPEERMKGKLPHILPLSYQSLGIIESILVPTADRESPLFGRGENGFGGWSKSFKLLAAMANEELGRDRTMTKWRIHDLRRSFVTHTSTQRLAAKDVRELFVAHVSGSSKSGVAGVYDRAELLPERRKLAQDYADWLMSVVS